MPHQRITIEEYQQIKRRLFASRRQYIRLLRRTQSDGPAGKQAARLRKLSGRIERLELRLAYSELDTPEEKPVTLLDVVYEIGFYLRRAWPIIRHNDPIAEVRI